MIWFQSTTTNLRGAWAKPKDHDSVAPIIVEICHNSSLSDLFPRCETLPVAFLPQVLRPEVGFWAKDAELSILGHGAATNANAPLMCLSS
jgi:hypothetical protein